MSDGLLSSVFFHHSYLRHLIEETRITSTVGVILSLA